jgi:hypothetical protein
VTEHSFTAVIAGILKELFGEKPAKEILERSDLVGYLNAKTRSASRGSKARGSFANLYAIYVMVEDYIAKGYAESGQYDGYEGAQYTDLLQRQRQLPFGSKLQNHALNSRLNGEFRTLFPMSEYIPIVRDRDTSRYWFFNEGLVKFIPTAGGEINLARAVIRIIDAYIQAKRDAFDAFLATCQRLTDIDAGATMPNAVSSSSPCLLRRSTRAFSRSSASHS